MLLLIQFAKTLQQDENSIPTNLFFLPKTVFDRIPKEELSHADEIAAVWHFDVSQPQFHFCFTFDNND